MKRRRFQWYLPVSCLAAVMLCATPGETTGARKKTSRPFVVRAHVVDDDTGRHAGRVKRRVYVDAYDTELLEFDVYWRRRATRELPTHVDLYLPNGDLYRSVDVDTVSVGRGARKRSLAATARVPIAGTVVTRYELYGRWRADVCWESGTERTCQRALRFFVQH